MREWRTQTIAAPDIFGNGHIGPRAEVEAKINRIKWNYYQQVGENIAGGPFGAAGYIIGGEEGSFDGAKVDQAVQAGAALQKPTVNSTLPHVQNRTLVPQNKTVRKNGSTAANRRGVELHKEYKKFEHDPQNGRHKEYTGLLKKYGIKPDFVDFNTRTFYDLKPNNP
jgi:hypothetical protein